jgi:hypothetical protein
MQSTSNLLLVLMANVQAGVRRSHILDTFTGSFSAWALRLEHATFNYCQRILYVTKNDPELEK